MATAYTLEEAQAIFAEKGIEFTAAAEATMRQRGLISETPIWTGNNRDRDPRFADADAIPTNKPIVRDPYANTETGETNIDLEDPSSTGFNIIRGYVKGASHLPFVGNIDMAPDEHPDSKLAQYSELGGEMLGMATQLGVTAPVAAPIGALAKGGMLGKALARSQQVGTQFGLYGTGVEGSTEEQLKSGGAGYAMGAAFGALPFVPGVGRVMSNPVLGPLADIGIFTGIEKAGGAETWRDALERGTVSALALRTAHAGTGRPGTKTAANADKPRLEKTPAEKEAAQFVDPVVSRKQAELDALIAESRQKETKRTDKTPRQMDELDQQLVYDNAVRSEIADIRRQFDLTLPRPVRRSEQLVPTDIPAETRPLPDVQPNPHRDAAMREYNNIIGGPRGLIGHEPTAHRFSPHGYGEVMRERQFGPVVDEPMAPVAGQFRKAKSGEPRARTRRDARRGQDVTTDMLGLQQLYEGASRGAVRLKEAVSRNTEHWKQFSESATDVPRGSDVEAFSKHLKGEIAFRDIPRELERSGAYFDPISRLPKDPAEQIRVLEKNLDPEFVRDVRAGRVRDTDPGELVDRNTKFETIGGNTHNSATVRQLLRMNQTADLSAMKGGTELRVEINDLLHNNNIKGADEVIAGRLLELMRSNHQRSDFLSNPAAQKLLLEAGSPRDMVNFVEQTRAKSDVFWGIMDQMSRVTGGDGVGRLDGHFHKTAQKPGALDMREKFRRTKAKKNVKRSMDTSTRDDKFNPAAKHRTTTDPDVVILDGREVNRDWNVRTVMDRYIDYVVESTTAQASIRKNAHAVRYLELMGKPRAAESINRYTQGAYNQEKTGFMGNADAKMNSSVGGRLFMGAMTTNKRLFDGSHYRLNPRFSLGTQIASLGPQAVRHPVATAKAILDLTNPAAIDAMLSTYTAKVKGQPRAGVGFQADSTPYASHVLDRAGVPRKAGRAFMDGLTKGVESSTNVLSGLIATHTKTGETLAAKGGRDFPDYVSTQQQKWQDMYTPRDRPPVLNSRLVQGSNPAQSYNIGFGNRIAEAFNKHHGIDSGKGRAGRTAEAGFLVGARLTQDLFRAALWGYGGWTQRDVLEGLLGQIPFGAMLTGWGPSGGKTLNANSLQAFLRAGDQFAGLFGDDPDPYALAKNLSRWVKAGTFGADVIREIEGEGPYTNAAKMLTGQKVGGPSEDRR